MFERTIAKLVVDPRERWARAGLLTLAALLTATAPTALVLDERFAIERMHATPIETERVVRLPTPRLATPVWADEDPAPTHTRVTQGDGEPTPPACTSLDLLHRHRPTECSIRRPGTVCAFTRKGCTCRPVRSDPLGPTWPQ
jgi:hypothetical protein